MKKLLSLSLVALIATTAAFADTSTLADDVCSFSHSVQGGGVEMSVPVTNILSPTQSIIKDGETAYLPALSVNTFQISVLDMRGTKSPITLKATLTPLSNGEVVRPTTVRTDVFGGPNPEGLRSTAIEEAEIESISATFIEADAMVNRSFTADVEITAGEISGQDVLTGTYTGQIYFEVN